MKVIRPLCLSGVLAGMILCQTTLNAQNTNRLELADGDRIVFVGDTLIERESRYGYLEYGITVRFPNLDLTFRNLGWSADLPTGLSRMSFDWNQSSEESLKRLVEQIREQEPSVVFLGYGMAASFAGEEGLPAFERSMQDLIGAIKGMHPRMKLVLLSPIRHEALPGPLPDPGEHNEALAKYTEVLGKLAQEHDAYFVNFFENLRNDVFRETPPPLTDNGIHLNDYGYRRAEEAMARELKWFPNMWRLGLTSDGQLRRGTVGAQVFQAVQGENHARAVILSENVVPPPFQLEEGQERPPMLTPPPWLQIRGLSNGWYDMKIDGEFVDKVTAFQLITPALEVVSGPPYERAQELLETIRQKNELFFHRWRPQNSTYLFLFRKHEQGQNAAEVPRFDPLIAEQERRIFELRKPVEHVYELTGTNETNAPAATVSSAGDALAAEPAPYETASSLVLPGFQSDPNLEIQLWAENPLLAKPIQINWDAQGRLWVASSTVYPQIKPGQPAEDRVIILEDTNGDGVADASTVFAEGLLIPTGVEPGDGGAYVAQSTELLHFTDADGDGRADGPPRVVLSGFGTEDTHHLLHTLRWGYDGRLYMNQSIYIHSHLETPHGVVRLNSGGILGLQPRTMSMEILMKGLVNSWGHHFDYYGQSFATDGAGTPQAGLSGVTYVVPGAMYHTYAGARRILGSVSPGSYPKFCGLEFLHSPHFPDEWQGQLVTCDFRANRVVRFQLEQRDSAYVASEQDLFLRSTNVTFRPIDVKVGPDGALYLADWSNPIIQHGEVDFRDERRDKVHGRIWRITYRDRALASTPEDLADLPAGDLLDLLLSKHGNTRRQARRVLLEREEDWSGALSDWVAAQDSERAKLEGLWMRQATLNPDPELLASLLGAEDGRVRAAAVRVLADWHGSIPDAMRRLGELIEDEHPRVRLEALRALSEFPSGQAAALALRVLEKPMDEHLDYALWLTVNDLAEPWVASIRSGEWTWEGREDQLIFGLNALEPRHASQVMDRLFADRSLEEDGSGPWIDLIGKAGRARELQTVYDQVLRGGFTAPASVRGLEALQEAARLRGAKPTEQLRELPRLFNHENEAVRVAAIGLAGIWKQGSLYVDDLVELVRAAETPDAVRARAFQAMRDTGGAKVLQALQPLAQDAQDAEVRRQALVALAGLDMGRAAPIAVEVLSSLADEGEALRLWRELLRNRGAAAAMTAQLPATGLSPVLAKTGLRAAREGGRNEPELILALSRGADLDDEAQDLSPAEMRQLAAAVQEQGRPGAGEEVYRRMELACVTCHAIGGVGGKVGPDLTSIGASAPVDYLIESLLYPNRKVKEGYHSVVLETEDGEQVSGILVRETGEEVYVRDVLNREVAVAKNNIASRAAGNSLMPAGLVDSLSRQDRLDLFRFMAELGKPGPFDATKGNVARYWRLAPATIDLVQFGDARVVEGDLQGGDWLPAFTMVDGRLPREELGAALNHKSWRNPEAVYAVARFDLAQGGEVTLQVDSVPSGAGMWVDGRPVTLENGSATLTLEAGAHRVAFKFGKDNLPEDFRLRANPGTFLVD